MPLYEYDGNRPSLADDGSNWIAPSAELIGDARLGRDVSIWFGVVIRADNTPITIGDGTNIQERSVLHSDPGKPLTIGRSCTVGHGAILHGCTIGDNVLVGMGAVVLNGAIVGDNCLIGAGALLTEGKTFPPGSLIKGAPARVSGELGDEAIAAIREAAADYARKQRRYAQALVRVDG